MGLWGQGKPPGWPCLSQVFMSRDSEENRMEQSRLRWLELVCLGGERVGGPGQGLTGELGGSVH